MGTLNSGSNRRFGFFDRPSLFERVAGERTGLRGGNTIRLILSQERLLPSFHQIAKLIHIDTGGSSLREDPIRALLLLMDVMLYLFRQHLDLGVVEFLVRRAGKQLGDQHLTAVVLDIAFIQQTGLDFTPASRIENLFFDNSMSTELRANPLDQRLLFGCAFGGLELGKQVLHIAVVSLQQGNGVLSVFIRHNKTPLKRSSDAMSHWCCFISSDRQVNVSDPRRDGPRSNSAVVAEPSVERSSSPHDDQ